MRRSLAKGFSLIELMIVLSIIGILAMIAYPAYTDYVRRSSRADVKAILLENAQAMERWFTLNNVYTGGSLVSAVSPKGASGSSVRYAISFVATPTDTAWTLQAVPQNGQNGDACGTLTLTQTGAQTPTVAGCW